MIRPDLDEMIAFLNSALALDRVAVSSLLLHRHPCNSAISDHPTIQVSPDNAVSVLGLLNGYYGAIEEGDRAGWGALAAIIEGGLITQFVRTETPEWIEGEGR